jgi:hypothetical protein
VKWSRAPLLAVAGAILVPLMTAVAPAVPAVAAAPLPRCGDSQLALSTTTPEGAALSAAFVVRYRDVSSSACTLSGYSTVIALVSPTGPSVVAAHEAQSYFGGWERAGPLPTVVLAAHNGVASSLVSYLAPIVIDPRPDCPRHLPSFRARSLWVGLPGGARPFVLVVPSMVVCGYLFATPIVPGTTGGLGGWGLSPERAGPSGAKPHS